MQLTLDGRAIDEVAIDRIKTFEYPKGYKVAFSGGKDSVVVLDLVRRAGVKYKAVYNWTTIDPPETILFIKQNYPEVLISKPEKTMWQLISENKMLPQRQRRWCCRILKEQTNDGEFVITGIWAQESTARAKRRMVEVCRINQSVNYLHPIIDWSVSDCWLYIQEGNLPYHPLYDEGFKRIGCILCPMVSGWQLKQQIKRFPKTVNSYQRAAIRLYERGVLPIQFKSGEHYFKWWITRQGFPKESGQDCFIFAD